MQTSHLAKALIAAVTIASMACAGGPWPNRPPRMQSAIKSPMKSTSEAPFVRGKTLRLYWTEAPEWVPVRSPSGTIVGRKSGNTPAVRLTRLEGAGQKWPDLCLYSEVSVKQEALNSAATEFGKTTVLGERLFEGGHSSLEVDCSVIENLP
jgi:hypothetical protein